MLLKSFLDYLSFEKQYSLHTRQAYERDLGQLKGFLNEIGIDLTLPEHLPQINHKQLRAWALSLIEKGNSARTVARKLSSARSFFHYTRKKEFIASNPAEKVILPKVEHKLPSFLKLEEVRLLLDEMEFPTGFEGARDRCILEILYGCGLRRSELLSLGLEDIDLYAKQLKVKGKGGKERIVPFGKACKEAIEAYLSEKNQLGYTDKSVLILRKNGLPAYPKLLYSVVYKYIGKVSSLNQRGPHTLRHTYATHMLDNGADLNAIKELLGHKSLASTQVYTHNSITKLKKIHQQAHPRADQSS